MSDLIKILIENPTIFYIAVAILSLCVGSFLNVVIYRTPKMMESNWKNECQILLDIKPIIQYEKITLNTPPSTCPKCSTRIKWFQNIPVASWLALRGKCGSCNNPISVRYPMVEIFTMICGLVVASIFGVTIQTVFGLILTYSLIALSFIDYDVQLLPDSITLPMTGLGLAINSYDIYISSTDSIWGCVLGFLCLWSVYYVFKLITGKEGMGHGDFKLLAMLGAWVGVSMLPLIVIISSILGSIFGFVLLRLNKSSNPFAFGYFLAMGGWVTFLWGDSIVKMYMDYAFT